MALHVIQFNQQLNDERLEAARASVADQHGRPAELLLLQDLHSPDLFRALGWTVVCSPLRIVNNVSGNLAHSCAVAVDPSNGLRAQQIPHNSDRCVGAVVTKPSDPSFGRLIAISVYMRPTEAQTHEGMEQLNADVTSLFQVIQRRPSDRWVIGGDFNQGRSPWAARTAFANDTRQDSSQLIHFIAGWGGRCVTPPGMTTWVSSFARTTPDLTITGHQTIVSGVHTLQLEAERDHLPITFTIHPSVASNDAEVPSSLPLPNARPMGDLRKVNWMSFQTALTQLLRRLRTSQLDSNALWSSLTTSLRQALDQSRPSPTLPRLDRHRSLHIWWDDTCAEALKARRQSEREAAAQAMEQPSMQDILDERLRRRKLLHAVRTDPTVRSRHRQLRHAVRKAKSSMLMDVVGNLSGRRGWAAVSALRGTGKGSSLISPPLRQPDGSYATSPSEKVNLLVRTMFPSIDPVSIPPDPIDSPTSVRHDATGMPRVTLEEVTAAAKAMDVHRAGGPDGIPPSLLRQAILGNSTFADVFTLLADRCVRFADFPDAWRTATVSIIPKPGSHRDHSLPKSYRPISLLNVASKLVDAIITARIHHLSAHARDFLRTSHHFASLPGVSSTDAVGTILEKGRNALRSRQSTALACIDVGGAFNNIDHRTLVDEIRARQQPALANWLASWLQQRTFTVRFEGYRSERFSLGVRGVPQGSPLSPILWTLYLDSFFRTPSISRMERILVQGGYVDDLFVLAYGPTPEAATATVQGWLDLLYEWCRTRSLSLDKPSFLVDDADSRILWRHRPNAGVGAFEGTDLPMGTETQHCPLVEPPQLRLMDGSLQPPDFSVRILGIRIDSRLDTTAHVERTAAKVAAMANVLGSVVRSAGGMTLPTRKRIVQAIFHATLDYACPALLPLNRIATKALEVADRAMFRFLFLAKPQSHMPSATAFAQELGWLLSKDRWGRLGLKYAARQLGAQTPFGAAMRQRDHNERRERSTLLSDPSLLPSTPFEEEVPAALQLAPTDLDTPFPLLHREGARVGIGARGRGAKVAVGPWRYLVGQQLPAVERVAVPSTPPWQWRVPEVSILDAEQAKKTALFLQKRQQRQSALLFTDGSRKEVEEGSAGVGAAVYGKSTTPVLEWTYTIPMSSTTSDIFDAELTAIEWALRSCLEVGQPLSVLGEADPPGMEKVANGTATGLRWRRIDVLSDSQAALQRLQAGWKRDRSAGQSICRRIRELLERLRQRHPGVSITLRWVPSHCGIEGNECADEAANRAAERRLDVADPVHSYAKVFRAIDERTCERSEATWQEHRAPGHYDVSPIHRSRPTKTYDGLRTGRSARILLKWRTNNIPSSQHLHFDDDTPECLCGHEVRNREHLLLHCPLLEPQRRRVQTFFPPNERDQLQHLLVGGERAGEEDRNRLYLEALTALIEAAYVQRYPPRDVLAARRQAMAPIQPPPPQRVWTHEELQPTRFARRLQLVDLTGEPDSEDEEPPRRGGGAESTDGEQGGEMDSSSDDEDDEDDEEEEYSSYHSEFDFERRPATPLPVASAAEQRLLEHAARSTIQRHLYGRQDGQRKRTRSDESEPPSSDEASDLEADPLYDSD